MRRGVSATARSLPRAAQAPPHDLPLREGGSAPFDALVWLPSRMRPKPASI
jgi:hypothetical protein